MEKRWRLERTFVAHNEIPGHPDFCVQQSVQVKVWDCLLGSPESHVIVWVDWTASLDRKKVLKALRMAVKRMEYDNKLDEFFRLKREVEEAESRGDPCDARAAAGEAV